MIKEDKSGGKMMDKFKMVGEIITMAAKLNHGKVSKYEKDGPTVFVYYSGHIDEISLRICLNGWDREQNSYPDYAEEAYMDNDEEDYKILNMYNMLKKLYDEAFGEEVN